MRQRIWIMACLMACSLCGTAQPNGQGAPQGGQAGNTLQGKRVYSLIVDEGAKKEQFERGLEQGRSSRGLLMDIVNLYRQNIDNKWKTAAGNFIDKTSVGLTNLMTDKRSQWEAAVTKECTFVRKLLMQQEILDFYQSTSTQGPLDPTGMLFNGFGCKQVIHFEDSARADEDVFYISCKLRTDSLGQARIVNHSKFEIEVDSLLFNPSLCDLPNDSLGEHTETRIGFSFQTRKNLQFALKATVTSSWMNQAMQVVTDQTLGEFTITVAIDSLQLDKDGVFRYKRGVQGQKARSIRVVGDCFLVPRSYVGCFENGAVDMWGTGQYKVEMQVTESCQVNEGYYKPYGEWNKARWQPEWKNIKKRKPAKSILSQVWSEATTEYREKQWIVKLVEPVQTVVVEYGKKLVNAADASMMTTGAASGAASPVGAASSAGAVGGMTGK